MGSEHNFVRAALRAGKLNVLNCDLTPFFLAQSVRLLEDYSGVSTTPSM
jgi:hypothetical protein